MDENKEFEMNEQPVEEQAEEAVETVEETVEEVVEAVEEAAEDTAEAVSQFGEEAEEAAAEIVPEIAEQPKKKGGLIAIIAIVAVIAIVVIAGFATKILPWNKYNHLGYVNITGKTLSDIAAENEMELSELLEQYGLPADMKGNTEESAAYYMMPVKRVAQMYGMDFATMKEMLGFSDEVTEDTAWGEAEGEVTLGKYVGEDYFEDFKKEYGFGDEVTLETKWKEVRKTVDMASKKKYDEQKAEQEKKAAETPVAETAAPAEESESAEEPAEEVEAAEEPAEEAAE